MSRVTSKLQVTIPKALAGRYGIRPGDEVHWELLARGAVMVRVDPGGGARGPDRVGEGRSPGAAALSGPVEARTPALLRDSAERVAHFDGQMRWIEALLDGRTGEEAAGEEERLARVHRRRGWSREDLHGDRGRTRSR